MLRLLGLYRIGYNTRTVHRSRPCISLPVDCASTSSLRKAQVNQLRTFTALAIVFAHFGWHTRQANNVSLSWRPGRIVLLLVDGTVGLSQYPLSFPVLVDSVCLVVGMGMLPTDHSFAWEGICSCLSEKKRQMRYPM